MADFMRMRWYPVVDDTIGGYAVSPWDLPVSGLDTRRSGGQFTVAHFAVQAVAEHIADLHNAWLKDGNSPAYLAEVAERARAQRAEQAAGDRRRDASLCHQRHGATPCPVCGSTWTPNDGD